MENQNNKQKMGLVALIMMIFTSVFGFTNIPRAFWLMGYSSILWYVLAALLFFVPYAFMLAEYGAAFKDSKGGIYTWMAESFSSKFAFVGIFMWYASYVIWMVNVGSGIWVPLSNIIFGEDTTQTWSLFGLNGVQTLGILGIIWLIFVTWVSTHGIEKIQKFTSLGGISVAVINVAVILFGIIILIMNGHMAEPLSLKAFIQSPNEAYQTPLQILSFLVFAVFAYGGLEVVGGLVDETKNPEKTFPKAIAISAIVIGVGYSIGIFIMGAFTDWNFAFEKFAHGEVTMANVTYVALQNMGYQMGLAFHLSDPAAMTMGLWVARFVGLSMFLSLGGAYFTIVFSPLKQLIEGTPKELWPKKWTETKNGLPVNAMKIQTLIVAVIILLVSFGGKSASKFFDILVAMTNVSMTIPYMFVAFAFIGFKKKQDIEKPFIFYKKQWQANLAVFIVLLVVGFANVFTIIQPAIDGDVAKTLWSIAGPVLFSAIALIMFTRYEKKHGSKAVLEQ